MFGKKKKRTRELGNEDLKTKTSKRLRQILAFANSSGNLSEDRGGGEREVGERSGAGMGSRE